MRETHKKVTELIHSGDLNWTDELDQTFEMLIEVSAGGSVSKYD